MVLSIGPSCEKLFPHIKFDLDVAANDEARSSDYLKGHGETAAQIASYLGPTSPDAMNGFNRLANEGIG